VHVNASDHDLIDNLKAGNERALDEIMRRYKERVYRFSWRQLGNEEAALDITQETFTRVYFNSRKFDTHYKFSTWVFQIALNLCRDYRRKNRHFATEISLEVVNDMVSGWDKSTDDTQASLEWRQQLSLLRTEIAVLPDKLREAFVLFAVEEMPQTECAELLGVSVKTIETRVYRARRILAEKLEQSSKG